LIFAGQLFTLSQFFKTCIGFLAFSILASIVYIINDINDLESDRKHPVKCLRPLASGEVSIKNAKILLGLLMILVLLLNYSVAQSNYVIWVVMILYIGFNIAYSMGLKNIALIDIFILVMGFIFRVYYGALIISVDVSSWLYLTVISMAFFLGLGKRRNEMSKQGANARKVLIQYNADFLDKNMYICLGLTIAFYSLWCEAMVKTLATPFLLSTVPLVIMICMKYSLDIEGNSEGDPIEVVYSDKILLLLIGLYTAIMAILLYGEKVIQYINLM
jgi:4-hydroxybenzoate polyprenyltransferase